MSNKKDKIAIFIIVIILLNISLVGVMLYFLTPPNPSRLKKEYIAELVDFSSCQSKSYQHTCYDTKYIKNKTYNVIYEKVKVDDTTKKLVGASLYINDTELINQNEFVYHIENHLYFTDSTIVLAIYEPSIKNIKVHIYDYEGNKLKEIYELDKENEIKVKDFKVKEDKIIFTGRKEISNNSVVLSFKGDTKFIFENADICKHLLSAKIDENELYQAEYELRYVSDKKFSTIKLKPGTEMLLGEYVETLDCDN